LSRLTAGKAAAKRVSHVIKAHPRLQLDAASGHHVADEGRHSVQFFLIHFAVAVGVHHGTEAAAAIAVVAATATHPRRPPGKTSRRSATSEGKSPWHTTRASGKSTTAAEATGTAATAWHAKSTWCKTATETPAVSSAVSSAITASPSSILRKRCLGEKQRNSESQNNASANHFSIPFAGLRRSKRKQLPIITLNTICLPLFRESSNFFAISPWNSGV
jgi:hypothetical protein